MKKFFLIAAAAAMVLSSCSKNTVSEDTSDANAINFGAYSGRATKAGDAFATSTALPENTSFGVYGYSAINNHWAIGDFLANFMENSKVTYNSGNAALSASYSGTETKYWPKTNGIMLSFFAYYPYNASVAYTPITPATSTSSAKGIGSFAFTPATDPANQVDFMVSDVEPNLTYATAPTLTGSTEDGVVALNFHHTLTQVNIKAKLDQVVDGLTVTVGDVKFTDIKTTGKLTMGYTAPVYDALGNITTKSETTYDWGTTVTGDGSYKIPTASPVQTLNGTAQLIGKTDKYAATILAMPQTFAGTSAKLEFHYTISDGTNTKDCVAYLDLSKGTDWIMGKNVTYSLTLKLFYDHNDEIADGKTYTVRFTASVDNWVNLTETPLTL
jgi:hypothetical protein